MNPSDLNNLLLWCLRFAYPLTLLVLWRRWWPGNWFGAYLAAASLWVWVYDRTWQWTVGPSLLTSPLEYMTTRALVMSFVWHDEPQRSRRILILMDLAFMLGVIAVARVNDPVDRWDVYNLLRTCLHGGVLVMMVTLIAYAKKEGLRADPGTWQHAIIWTCYTVPAVWGMLMDPQIPDTDDGAVMWAEVTNWIYAGSLLCLVAWILCALRVPRGGRDRRAGAYR